MAKESSIPRGFTLRTKAPKWHSEMMGFTLELIKLVKQSDGGNTFSDEDSLGVYRFLLECGLKKNESTKITWEKIVKVCASLSSNGCVPKPEPKQLSKIESLLRKIEKWKYTNLHHSNQNKLSKDSERQFAINSWSSKQKSKKDDQLIRKARRATNWKPVQK